MWDQAPLGVLRSPAPGGAQTLCAQRRGNSLHRLSHKFAAALDLWQAERIADGSSTRVNVLLPNRADASNTGLSHGSREVVKRSRDVFHADRVDQAVATTGQCSNKDVAALWNRHGALRPLGEGPTRLGKRVWQTPSPWPVQVTQTAQVMVQLIRHSERISHGNERHDHRDERGARQVIRMCQVRWNYRRGAGATGSPHASSPLYSTSHGRTDAVCATLDRWRSPH